MWGCGLKCPGNTACSPNRKVTPYVGVWIEIKKGKDCHMVTFVTPYVGVWIEIIQVINTVSLVISHPLCGGVDWNLKEISLDELLKKVTPYVGVWIEID